jgi:hypothetical protein
MAMGQHHVMAMGEGRGEDIFLTMPCKHIEGEVQHHSFITSALVDISGQLHTKTTLHPGKNPGTQ